MPADLLFHRVENLNRIGTVAQVVLSHVDGFLLDNLLLAPSVSSVGSETVVSTVARVASLLLEKWLVAR